MNPVSEGVTCRLGWLPGTSSGSAMTLAASVSCWADVLVTKPHVQCRASRITPVSLEILQNLWLAVDLEIKINVYFLLSALYFAQSAFHLLYL